MDPTTPPADSLDRRLADIQGQIGTNSPAGTAIASARFELAQLRADKARHERWFKTLDAQLRVLDRERQKFVAVVNQSDTFVCVVDPSLSIVWANNALTTRLESAFGIGRDGVGLRESFDALGLEAADSSGLQHTLERAFHERAVVHAELRRGGEGERRSFYLTGLPILGPQGTPDEVLVLVQDLSDLEVLRKSEARYRLLFERSPDAMVMVDPRTMKIVLANPVASRLTDWSTGELLGLTLDRLHDPEDWANARADFERAVAQDGATVAECVLLSRSGQRILATMSSTRFDLDGRLVVLVDYQDNTERKRLETQLRHSHKMEAIGRLAGGVAHDFNNLLTVILGQSERLARHLDGDERLRGLAESVQQAAFRGALLTRQLLAFGRKEVLQALVLDLNEVVGELQTLLARLIGEDIELATALAPHPCWVRIDRGQLEQVIMNLVVNARDAMPRGGRCRIEVSCEDRAVVLRVEDEGCGMDAETMAHLFEPFFTTKERGKGTGLGLSTSYAIVQEYQGRIEVTSAIGKGTTFTITFPMALDPGRPVKSESAARIVSSNGNETILLVEDEAELRKMAAQALELASYSVIEAACGEEALEICRDTERAIDLLLTDVIMPGMGGGELVQRATQVRPGLRVLYMSGYTDDSVVRHGVSGAEAAFLQKPFTLDALSRKVREVLDPV